MVRDPALLELHRSRLLKAERQKAKDEAKQQLLMSHFRLAEKQREKQKAKEVAKQARIKAKAKNKLLKTLDNMPLTQSARLYPAWALKLPSLQGAD